MKHRYGWAEWLVFAFGRCDFAPRRRFSRPRLERTRPGPAAGKRGFPGIALLLALIASGVTAGETSIRPDALRLRTIVEKIIETRDPSGELRTERVPAGIVAPGDEVVYTVRFKNTGDRPAENILITNPIPRGIRYMDGTAFAPGTEILYSADGGVSYAEAGKLEVSDENGRTRTASADDYTHIRWQLERPLDPGAEGFARFRAVVR
jgi:uncharacterized repeat protein (TIGR01451 family)